MRGIIKAVAIIFAVAVAIICAAAMRNSADRQIRRYEQTIANYEAELNNKQQIVDYYSGLCSQYEAEKVRLETKLTDLTK